MNKSIKFGYVATPMNESGEAEKFHYQWVAAILHGLPMGDPTYESLAGFSAGYAIHVDQDNKATLWESGKGGMWEYRSDLNIPYKIIES